jgi:hypothetical protein
MRVSTTTDHRKPSEDVLVLDRVLDVGMIALIILAAAICTKLAVQAGWSAANFQCSWHSVTVRMRQLAKLELEKKFGQKRSQVEGGRAA